MTTTQSDAGQPNEPTEWLSTKQGAELLGVTEGEVRRRVHAGELAAESIRGSMRFDRAVIEAGLAKLDRIADATAVADDPAALVEKVSGRRLSRYPLLLTPEQAAEVLGTPRSTVYSMLRSGVLPFRMVGRTKRVPLPALIRWLTDQGVA